MEDVLGLTMRDSVTGFTGVVTGKVDYLTGCTQLLLTPPVGKDGTFAEGRWFDVQRCAVVKNKKRITVDNSQNNGCDIAAPTR